MDSLQSLSMSAMALISDSSPVVTDRYDDHDVQPSVYLTDGTRSAASEPSQSVRDNIQIETMDPTPKSVPLESSSSSKL